MPLRIGFYIKPKNKQASKKLAPQSIPKVKPVSQNHKVRVPSNNNKNQEKVNPCFVITKVSVEVSLGTIKEEGVKPKKGGPKTASKNSAMI